jgi:aminopeptidase N
MRVLIGFCITCTVMTSHASDELPSTVRPASYELRLHPDATNRRFNAQVRIVLQVTEKVADVQLNAKDLTFDEVRLEDGRRARVTLDPTAERAGLRFAGGVAAGRHTLMIRYHGAIAIGTLGFFAMDYDTAAGKRRTLATNFEPASERTFMPSWDEPGRKAKFRITVDAPADRMAVSNMPPESETPLPDGMKRVRFAQTPNMSTYLLFLCIGDFERITRDVDGIKVGVVVAAGETTKGEYALDQAAGLLRYYNDYFGIRYPLPKLDLVAAPGQIQGGSMENWGAILYSQDHLLFDPSRSTESGRQRVFGVVSHEMAHQWFGDLVTMGWWDNLWLNEGFARWMQSKAADDLHPAWKTGLQASSIVERGMRADAKASTHPIEQSVESAAEAETVFDEITYDKGATVIGMLENYLGPDPFRDGVRRYMRTHAYGNTTSDDLWRDLQAATGVAVPSIAEAFTRNAGLPLVTVSSEFTKAGEVRVDLTQSRFFEAHDSTLPPVADPPPTGEWQLPIRLESVSSASQTLALLKTGQTTVTIGGSPTVVANAGRKSYTRVRYAPPAFAGLASAFGTLAPADQIALLQDAWALGQSDYAPITNGLRLVEALPFDASPIVWSKAIQILVSIDRLYAGLPGANAYRGWARARVAPLAARLGWEPAADEDSQLTILRAPLLLALSRFGDTAIVDEARRRYAEAAEGASPETRRVARQIAASTADPVAFRGFVSELMALKDPLQKQELLEDMAGVADPELAQQVLELAIGPQAPAGSIANLWDRTSVDHPDQTWSFAVAHVDVPDFPMDRATRMYLLPLIPSTSTELRRSAELREYATAHLPPAAARSVESAVSDIELNARIRAHGLPVIDEWLRSNPLSWAGQGGAIHAGGAGTPNH